MKDERSELLSWRRHKDWRGAKQTEQFSHVVRAQVARSGQQSWSPSSSPGQQENRKETGGDYINKQPLSHGDFYVGETSHHQVHHSTINGQPQCININPFILQEVLLRVGFYIVSLAEDRQLEFDENLFFYLNIIPPSLGFHNI